MYTGKSKQLNALIDQTPSFCLRKDDHTAKFGVSAVPLALARTSRVPERSIGQTPHLAEKRNDSQGRGGAGAAALWQKHERSLRVFGFVINPAGSKVTPDECLMGENHD